MSENELLINEAPQSSGGRRRGKKKGGWKLFLILVLLVLIACGAVIGIYYATPVKLTGIPEISLNGKKIDPVKGYWNTSVLNGMFEKKTLLEEIPEKDVLYADAREFTLKVPEDCEESVRLSPKADTETVFYEGGAKGFNEYEFTANGSYRLEVVLDYPATEESDRAVFSYVVTIDLNTKPVISFSTDKAKQGDIITAYVDMQLSNNIPDISTELAEVEFINLGQRQFEAFVPVDFAQKIGTYEIVVTADSESETAGIVVTERSYASQNLIMSQETINATSGNPNASADFAEKVKACYETSDEQVYWEGSFIQPVEGRISTQFGLHRYTNGSATSRRHTGIDIAAEEGTPVPASNSGRVVFSGEVIMTGNTVIIEHGAGLKTYYYHLSELNCEEGERVSKGDIIGKVGSTGYSTGPHLHFEVRMFEKALSPWELFDGTSKLYSFEKEE